MDLVLNNLHRLICDKTQTTNQPTSPRVNFQEEKNLSSRGFCCSSGPQREDKKARRLTNSCQRAEKVIEH